MGLVLREVFSGLVAPLALLVAVGACGRSATRAEVVTEAPLEVAVSGCGAVDDDGTCHVPTARTLRLWVAAAPDARVSVSSEGRAITLVKVPVAMGVLFTFHAPDGARDLDVRVDEPRAYARVVLAESVQTPPRVARAQERQREGDLEGAAEAAEEAIREGDERERALATGVSARVSLRRGENERAVALFEKSIEAHRAKGRLSDAVEDSFALAYVLHQRMPREGEASRVLDAITPALARYPDGLARIGAYRGQIAVELGDTRRALAEFRAAEARCERLGLKRAHRSARQLVADTMTRLGRAEEARDALVALSREASGASDATACERAEIATSAGLASLDLGYATSASVNARALEDARLCKDVYLRALTEGHLARAAMNAGRVDEAEAWLVRARASAGKSSRISDVVGWTALEGNIAFARGRFDKAAEAFDEASRIAARARRTHDEWRTLVLLGEALERGKEPSRALDAYGRAERALEASTRAVPLGEGQRAYVLGADKSARKLTSRLVAQGRVQGAMKAAIAGLRRGQVPAWRDVRALHSGGYAVKQALTEYRAARSVLEAELEDDWKASTTERRAREEARRMRRLELERGVDDALARLEAVMPTAPSPDAGAVDSVFARGETSPWIGFAADASGVIAYAIGDLDASSDPKLLAERMLGKARDKLVAARRVRVMLHPDLDAIDVGALPEGGAPLFARAPVVYTLMLGGAGPAPRAGASVVVDDASEDLPKSAVEGERVAERLGDLGFDVTRLTRRDAGFGAVRDAITRASFLHFAGHAVRAGRDGSASALVLAAGSELTLADVLALDHAPSRVVLSACETSGGASALGLAHAFLLAGTRSVLATTRPVDDGGMAEAIRAFYTEISRGDALDLGAALRRARLREPLAAWSGLRVLER